MVRLFYVIRRWLLGVIATGGGPVGASVLETMDDEALVAQARRRGLRDERPFRELWRRHQRMVWRTCYSFMRNESDAEDLVQDVFMKAYRSLDSFAGRAAFKTWLNRIAINTCKNELRRRARRPHEDAGDVDEMAEYLPASNAPSVESAVHQRALDSALTEALRRLRPEEYEVIFLRDIEERPYSEIAGLLDIGLSAAKMRVQRARLTLQHLYRIVLEEGVAT